MRRTRKFNIIVALILAITMVMPMSMTAYAAENEAYVYKYTKSEDFSNNDVIYANGSGSTPAYLRYVTGPDGKQQQYGGYCADFESNVEMGSMYSRTTIGEAGHFSASVTGHLRAILANSVPVKSLDTLRSASGVSSLDEGEAVAATQWAIWAYTNPSSPEIAVPKKDGTSDKEKAAYYLYNLPPINSAYATEPIRMSITGYQEGNKMIFDYSGSINIIALYDKVITVKDGSGKALPFTDENYNVIVDVSGLNKDQTVNIKIEGKQTLAADAYFYNPQGGRMASQSLISWFIGETSVAGTAKADYDVEDEKGQVVLTADKELKGREIDTAVDNFQFVVKDAAGKVAATGTANDEGKITFTPIEYNKTQVGKTFTYKMSEIAGTNPGMEYDTSVKEVKVTVKYVDGKVVGDVTYDKEAGLKFINKYTTQDTDVELKVFKKMAGNKELKEGMFQFTKVECDVNGVPLEGAETETVTNAADGTVVFEKDVYTETGTHFYLIKEVDGGKKIDGITYDDLKVIVKVTITDNKLGQLVANAEYPADITFDNKYTADADKVTLEGMKYLEGRPLADGEFTFVVKDENGKEVAKANNGKDGTFTFPAITFEKAGEFKFTVAEVIGNEGGLTYDNTIHEVVVTVTDDGKGQLHAAVKLPEGGLAFENTYKGQGEISVTKKFNLNDEAKAADLKFEVGLYTDADCTAKALYADGTEVENKVIDLNQKDTATVTFDGLEFGTYYVAEIGIDGMPLPAGEVTGMLVHEAYRQHVAYIDGIVTLTDAEKSGAAEIINDFYTEEYWTQGEIKVTKQVVVNGEKVEADATYFVALFADPELTVLASEVKHIEMKGAATASVVFEKLEINKTYYVAETDIQGTPLKAGDYNINEIVIENGNIKVDPAAPVHEAQIINKYETDDAELVIEGIKNLEGRALKAGEFEFQLKDAAGNVIETVVNNADGTFRFAPLKFKETGEYTYTIVEAAGNAEGVTYDTAVYKVKVAVTAAVGNDGKAKLTAVAEYPEGGVTFVNAYKGQGQLKVVKLFNINDMATTADLEFVVGIYTDAAFTQKAFYADGTEVENKVIDMNGHIVGTAVFDGLEYGTYYVAEIGIDGKPLPEGDVSGMLGQGAYKQVVTYIHEGVELTDGHKSGEVEIINDFYTEEYWLQGEIKVTKQVDVNDENVKSDATYFVALFADPELTVLASEVKHIEMNGAETASVTFEKLEINKTYYVAETDIQGTPLKAGDYHINEIVIENGNIKVVPAAPVHEALIINKYVTGHVELALEGLKTLEGRDLAEGEFTFVLKDAEGNVLEEVVNDADGKFQFAPLVFEETGEFVYMIEEIAGNDKDITYDAAIHEVKVTVVAAVDENGKGQLTAVAEYPDGGVVFINKYTDTDEQFYDEDEDKDDEEEYYEEEYYEEEKDKAVKTGDDFNVAFTGMMMLAALAAMVLAAAVRRKEAK